MKKTQMAVSVIRSGGVVAYPTEAVWGLGCDPWNQAAVEKILTIKRRPVEKGLILVAASESQITPLLKHLTPEQRQQLWSKWPGPVTFLIPDPEGWVPEWIRGQHDSVAVRVSAHPTVQELCEKWGKPLVSTSANRAGEEALRYEKDVISLLNDEIDFVLPGETGGATSPSTICDLRSGKIFR